MSANEIFQKVFNNTPQIDRLISQFDYSKMNLTNSTHLHTDLAPSYHKLSASHLLQLDDDLKIMIAGTMQLLSKTPDKSWRSVLSAMMQNALIQRDGEEIARSAKFVKKGMNVFKFDGSPDAGVVREVHAWFVDLIKDPEVLESTKINIDVLAKIVAQSGATVDSFEAFFSKQEHHEKTLVDIGVLRFPDIDRPYFKLYRIRLTAWSDSNRVLFAQDDSNGITGEYNAYKFVPRASIMKELAERSRSKAIAMANDLLEGLP